MQFCGLRRLGNTVSENYNRELRAFDADTIQNSAEVEMVLS